jgi:adenylate cyclase
MHALSITDDIVAADARARHGATDAPTPSRRSPIVLKLTSCFTYLAPTHAGAIMQTIATANDRASGEETGTVGFADLVGFTATSQQLSEHELAQMVERFEQIGYDHIPDRGGRVVKILGDDYVHQRRHPRGCRHCEALRTRQADASIPDVRVGLARAHAGVEGDVYGNTVNLASRLVGIANPGTVLLSYELDSA